MLKSPNVLKLAEFKGYANEVGEAFRSLVNKNVVRLSYGVAFAYVFADTTHKTSTAYEKEKQKESPSTSKVALMTADTLIWQTLASVAVPGFTINRVCTLCLYSLKKWSKISPVAQRWTTTAVGLAIIPFIIHPIDRGVDYCMDKTVRKWIGHNS